MVEIRVDGQVTENFFRVPADLLYRLIIRPRFAVRLPGGLPARLMYARDDTVHYDESPGPPTYARAHTYHRQSRRRRVPCRRYERRVHTD